MATNGLLTRKNFDKNKIIFEEPKTVNIKDEKFKAHKILIKYKYSETEIDKLSIKTPVFFSWGVQENNFGEKITYTFPLVMFNSNIGATKEEEKNIKIFETILKCCKKQMKLKIF